MAGPSEVVDSRSVFKGRLLEVVVDVVRLPSGELAEREIVRHPGAAAVVALQGDRVLLVRQNRHAVGRDLLELPAGKLDRKDEDPSSCARRELQEETGYRAGGLEVLGSFLTSPGFSDERVHLFLASAVEKAGPPPADDEGEPIHSEWLTLRAAREAVIAGEIEDSKTIIGLLLASSRLQR